MQGFGLQPGMNAESSSIKANATGGFAQAYNDDAPAVQLAAAACKYGVLLQAIIATGGKYIYVKVSYGETAPASAADYGIRLEDGESVYIPVPNLDKLQVWTDDTGTVETYLKMTRFLEVARV